MDGKKLQNVQASSSPASGQVRIKGGGDGTSAISGVRRKSGPQGLRSPAAKRPLSAPVALQGWLHKQGSEGLMLWKRRWFVLSEYCLFYYKGPEEEKLLGSILLPSYRVTVCRPEDKVNKKFAFKAEHANMRTYHFAAETRENMNQWVNALTLASLLQDPNPNRNTTIYGTRVPAQQQQQQQQATQATLRTDKSGLNYGLNYNQERRTPDTYGRSAKPRSGGGGGGGSRGNGDYEDVYGAPQLYQRPAGPVGYTKAPAPAPIPIPVYAQQIQQQQVYGVSPQVAPVMRQPKVHPPPRPHSADFLEYEANRRPDQQTLIQSDSLQNQSRRPQRPKSSLDIVNPSDTPANDNYFYSEERYAAQMRQSAVYIHQTPQHQQQQRNQSLSRATTPSMTSNRDRDVESGIGTLSENSCSGIRRSRGDHMQHIISSQPLQRHNDLASNEALLRRSLRERSYEPATNREMLIHNESGTVPRRMPRDYDPSSGVTRTAGMTASHVTNHSSYGSPAACHTGPRRWNEQQFARSASARLPRTRHPAAVDHDDDDDDDYADRSSNHDSRDGERKIQQREESMKRLLEWKQRMLQSPLTRKPSGSTNRGTAQNELSNYYKQQALLDLAAHEASVAEARHSRRREETHRPHVRSKSSDGRRSATNVSRYNSYSSDDEGRETSSPELII